MAKVRIITRFHDRADYSHVYEVGQTVYFNDDARVRSIVERGLGEIVEEERVEIFAEEVEKPIVVITDDTDTPKPSKKTTRRRTK